MTTRSFLILAIFTATLLVAGCSQEQDSVSPGNGVEITTKDGTEVLGPPSIPIASGTGFAAGGVGMVGVTSGQLTVEVPDGAQVAQAILYWAGGTDAEEGDDEISLDGTLIAGELIGGPVRFYHAVEFSAYRADITDLGLVAPGVNTFTVADFDFPEAQEDENNGASILVIYDDGTEAAITLRDGLDMAYFGFEPTLDATVPQVFAVEPEEEARTAELVILAASVGENRPTTIQVTTSGGVQVFENVLGSTDGAAWDSLILPIDVPAGADEISVQIVSTPSTDPRGASLGWVAAGIALQATEVAYFDISGTVFIDADINGVQDDIESGVGDVVVELIDNGVVVASAVTDSEGHYLFNAPSGDYTVSINLVDYPNNFNADLASSFDATTALSLSVAIGPDSSGNDFGFVPRADQLIEELENGDLTSDAISSTCWKKIFRRAMMAERSGRHSRGHDRGRGRGHHGHHGHGCGCGHGHPEASFTSEELRGFIAHIEGLYLSEPYQFTEGNEFREIFQILRGRTETDEEALFKEMLVTELNFAAGLGITGQADVVGALLAWGESLLAADEETLDKGRAIDITKALQLFATINTGGGGGVDE